MAMTEAEKAARKAEREQADQEAAALKEALGPLEIHPVTGVALDTTDSNYEQLKRIEDMKAEAQQVRLGSFGVGSEEAEKLRKAELDAEEARVRAQLAEAQAAANIGDGGGNQNVFDAVADQRAKAEAAEAAAKEGK